MICLSVKRSLLAVAQRACRNDVRHVVRTFDVERDVVLSLRLGADESAAVGTPPLPGLQDVVPGLLRKASYRTLRPTPLPRSLTCDLLRVESSTTNDIIDCCMRTTAVSAAHVQHLPGFGAEIIGNHPLNPIGRRPRSASAYVPIWAGGRRQPGWSKWSALGIAVWRVVGHDQA